MHEPDRKSKLNTNKVGRDWLLLPQNIYANLLEDLMKDIVIYCPCPGCASD